MAVAGKPEIQAERRQILVVGEQVQLPGEPKTQSPAKAFQLTAIVAGLIGMIWGLKMGISGDHAMMPAHAHLNLLGWVSLSLMAAYYRHVGPRAAPRLAWVNFVFSTLGLVVFAVALAFELSGHPQASPAIGAGAVLSMLGLITFGAVVVTGGE